MAAEIANRQLISIAAELETEGVQWADFLSAENIPFVDLSDSFARIDWQHYVSVMDAAVRRWGLDHLEDIAYRSVFASEVASFRDGVTVQCENLDEMMEYLFGDNGAFGSILPCVEYSFEKLGRRHWRVQMAMVPGYELSSAHCHFGIGVLRALPPLLYESPARVTLDMTSDRAHYDLRVTGWRPLAYLRLRYQRSKPNLGLAQRVGDTFAELMIRQSLLQAEAERRTQVEAELAHLEKLDALGRLTGSVAHDFNNLLTVIQGQLEMLNMEIEDPRQVERLEIATTAADRGARLTSQLLAFGRRATLQPETVNINSVIDDMLPLFSSTFDNLIVVRTNLDADLANTLVDRSQLETALLNLAINAKDAMADGGTITLTTSNVTFDEETAAQAGDIEPGRYAVVEVRDTGEGIAPNTLEHVFEPFFSTKSPGMGTGLGLSMVWGFLQQSGGCAKIHSQLNEGTTVQLYFPAVEAVQVATNSAQAAPEDRPSQAKPGSHILLVEDEEAVREVVKDMLRQLGYAVTAVGDAESAVASLRADSSFALLLTDVVLPAGRYGPEVASAARDLAPGLPVVYMSGYPEQGEDERSAIGPADVLLSKPFSFNELSQTLEEVLRSR